MKLKFEFQNQEHEVEAERIGTTLWVHFQGETFSVEPKISKRNIKQVEEGVATAPMPGKVTKIMAAIGDPISAGQVVVVMEAMKMEYSLKANGKGSLKSLNCAVGDQVNLGQKLFEVGKGDAP